MADGDAHFRLGVQHGFDDEPLYRWQDPLHQERYEAGYLIGRWSWVTQGHDAREAVLRRRRGIKRDG